MSKKIYLSGSTQENNQGVSNYGNEEARMQTLADRVKTFIEIGKGDFVIYRNNNGGMSLQQTIDNSNFYGPDIHVAIHSNAGGGQGTECYYYKDSAAGQRLAQLIYNSVAPLTISSDRGCKSDYSIYPGWGLAENRETTAIACLIEIMFHDNITDVADYLSKVDQIAEAMAKAIYNYFGVEYKKEVPISDRESGINKLNQVSKWANIYIKEFDALQAKGVNVWGLLTKFKV